MLNLDSLAASSAGHWGMKTGGHELKRHDMNIMLGSLHPQLEPGFVLQNTEFVYFLIFSFETNCINQFPVCQISYTPSF
jgi:hypothetical protein